MNNNPFLSNCFPNNGMSSGFGNQLQSIDERIWVSNQQAAESYLLVAANSFVRLWDSSQPRFYEKSTDCTGRPMQMRTFEYKEVLESPQMPNVNFVTSQEFTEFREKVNSFIAQFEEGDKADE